MATVVKLTRNLAILPVLLGATWLTVRAARAEGKEAVAGSSIRLVARAVPWFVIGFVVFAGLRTAGLLDGALPTGRTVADLCSTAATLLILVALAGVGISTDVRAMIGVGAGPFFLGAAMWLVMGLLALGLATVVAGSTDAVAGTAGAPGPAVYHGG